MNQHDLNLIELIIDASNSNFFSRLAKLLGVEYPRTRDGQKDLLMRVKRAWEKQYSPKI